MEIAAVVSTVLSGVSTVVSYLGAQREADALEVAAVAREQQAQVDAQIDVNNTIAEQNEIQATEAQTIFNRRLQAQIDNEKRDQLASEIARNNAKSYLTLSPNVRSFGDVFKAELQAGQNKLTSFDFESAQSDYGMYKQIEELDRKANYNYMVGMSKRDFTLAAGRNEAIQYRNEAAATRSAAQVGLVTGIAGTATSFIQGGSMVKDMGLKEGNIARKFYRV
jgi:hypothetical protein